MLVTVVTSGSSQTDRIRVIQKVKISKRVNLSVGNFRRSKTKRIKNF